ncbi:MAG: YceI family protein [Candidatus Binataceae bacterium]
MLVGLAMIVATAIGAAAPPAIAETIHLEADLQKSQISATVGEPLAVVRDQATATGAFRMNSCEIDGDPNNLAATAHVKLVIDATTYDSGSTTRDRNVIHSALETAKYQTIDFESTALEDVQIDVPGVSGSATVVGKLTLHGTTKIMRVPVRVSMSTDGEFSAGGEVQFRYTDFGIKAPRLVFLLPASDMTTVTFRILAQRPAAAAPPPQTRRQPIDDGRPQPRLASRQH